jgi:hypothetical protein
MGGSLKMKYCHSLIQLSRMLSRIERRLSLSRTLRTNAATIIGTICELDEELNMLKESLDATFDLQIGSWSGSEAASSELSHEHLLYLNYVYFGAALGIHTTLAFPWTRNLIGTHASNRTNNQISRSADIVAEVARESLLMTQRIELKAYTSIP